MNGRSILYGDGLLFIYIRVGNDVFLVIDMNGRIKKKHHKYDPNYISKKDRIKTKENTRKTQEDFVDYCFKHGVRAEIVNGAVVIKEVYLV